VERSLQTFGQPMSGDVLSFMEERFGCDFSGVQIHNDSLAHQSSADINAKAYTHQNHIVFGAGEYQPDTNSGKQLLAHELTHVIQQNAVTKPVTVAQKKDDKLLDAPEATLQLSGTVQTAKRKGQVNYLFEQKVVANYIWPEAWAAAGIVSGVSLGANIFDILAKAGIDIDIFFVAERKDIPVKKGNPLGYTDDSVPGRFTLYVLAGQYDYKWVQKGQVSSQVTFIIARPRKEIADTVFHELLHAWFMTTHLNVAKSLSSGHTDKALPLGDPKFDPKEYHPDFLKNLKDFQGELNKLMPKPKEEDLQLKCSECEKEEVHKKEKETFSDETRDFLNTTDTSEINSANANSIQSKTVLQRSFINQTGSVIIQRKSVDEPKKYEGIIDYKKEKKNNLDTRYSN
jgi:hypothetical protein